MITNRDLDAIGAPPAAPVPDARAAPQPPHGSDDYELVRDAATVRGGWSLRCRRGARVVWSMPLAPRGAAPGVRPTVAQAVAVRVLGELGVFVSGWNQLDDGADRDDARSFVARRPRRASALSV